MCAIETARIEVGAWVGRFPQIHVRGCSWLGAVLDVRAKLTNVNMEVEEIPNPCFSDLIEPGKREPAVKGPGNVYRMSPIRGAWVVMQAKASERLVDGVCSSPDKREGHLTNAAPCPSPP